MDVPRKAIKDLYDAADNLLNKRDGLAELASAMAFFDEVTDYVFNKDVSVLEANELKEEKR